MVAKLYIDELNQMLDPAMDGGLESGVLQVLEAEGRIFATNAHLCYKEAIYQGKRPLFLREGVYGGSIIGPKGCTLEGAESIAIKRGWNESVLGRQTFYVDYKTTDN